MYSRLNQLLSNKWIIIFRDSGRWSLSHYVLQQESREAAKTGLQSLAGLSSDTVFEIQIMFLFVLC